MTKLEAEIAEHKAEIARLQAPQDELFKELTGDIVLWTTETKVRILLQTILDLRAEREAGYSNVA